MSNHPNHPIGFVPRSSLKPHPDNSHAMANHNNERQFEARAPRSHNNERHRNDRRRAPPSPPELNTAMNNEEVSWDKYDLDEPVVLPPQDPRARNKQGRRQSNGRPHNTTSSQDSRMLNNKPSRS